MNSSLLQLFHSFGISYDDTDLGIPRHGKKVVRHGRKHGSHMIRQVVNSGFSIDMNDGK